MKKSLFLGVMAATMLFATSCQKDEDLAFSTGENAMVSFSVSTPEIATRAFSDGTTATKLQYAVYNEDGKLLPNLVDTIDLENGRATVNLPLITGDTYSVIFWAAAENAPYNVDFKKKAVAVNYTGAVSNDETRDAFYKYETFAVSGNESKTVQLTRPFAQINIGTNDFEDAKNGDFEPTLSSVTVKGIADTLSFDGFVRNKADRTFALDTIPDSTVEEFPVEGYAYVAMNYVLVGADKEVVDVTFTMEDANGKSKTRTVGSVPVQRNYRTNIYGSLLTSDIDVNVEIEPEYDDEYNNEQGVIIAEGKVLVSSAEGLQFLAERMANGDLLDKEIVLDGDIDLAAMTRAAVVSNWNPMGTSEEPFTGTFDGKGYTIKNLNIVETEAKEGKAYIGFFGYAKNATIKNVTFENVYINIPCLDIDHSQGHIGAVAGSLEGTSTIENVTVKGDIKVYATQDANGASRVAVVAGGNSNGNVTMKNVHVNANEGSYLIANNNTGALAGQLQGKSVFENCSSNIDVTVNKFFAGGIIGLAAGDQLFKNCHTTGDIAVVAGREGRAHDQYRVGGIAGGWADGKNNVCTLVGCSYTGAISGKNADGSVAEPLDYMGYVGRGYTLNGCAGSKVVIDGTEFVQKYNTVAEAGIYEVIKTVANAKELQDAIDNGATTIVLSDNVTIDENTRDWNNGEWYDGIYYVSDKNLTLDLNGKTLTHDGSVNDYLINLKNDGSKPNTVTIKNGVVDAGTTAYCALCTSSTNAQKITINLENVELINNKSYGSTIKVRGGAELNVKAGTKITGLDSYLGIEVVASTCNIYDGAEIYQNGTSSYLGGLVGVCGNGVANVYGGEGVSARCCLIAMTSGGVINVEGGKWTANTDGTIGDNSNLNVLTAQNNKNESGYRGASIINVTGGTFRGGMDAWILSDVNVEKAELNISGGNFNADPKHYVEDGYSVVENNGIYTVD